MYTKAVVLKQGQRYHKVYVSDGTLFSFVLYDWLIIVSYSLESIKPQFKINFDPSLVRNVLFIYFWPNCGCHVQQKPEIVFVAFIKAVQ